ncbi:MAG: hypothetical protein AB7E36_09965 [Salinivirgaceae bacterium]
MKTHRSPLISLGLLLIIFALSSCEKDKLAGDIIDDLTFIDNLYTHSSDTLQIDQQKIMLQTNLYRDFFPGVPVDNRSHRLIAVLYLVNLDSTLITSGFKASRLYVIHTGQAWVSEPENTNENNLPNYKKCLTSINGPEWETGIRVDVVISLTDLTTNTEKLLIARNQLIERIE